jgi:hypothetical protein
MGAFQCRRTTSSPCDCADKFAFNREVQAAASKKLAEWLRSPEDLDKIQVHRAYAQAKRQQWEAQLTSSVNSMVDDADAALGLLSDGQQFISNVKQKCVHLGLLMHASTSAKLSQFRKGQQIVFGDERFNR